MSDFKRLIVWRKSHALALAIHRAAARIRGVMYSSLRSQMVRAALSIPANIVEGRGQRSDREFARYLRSSLNSSSELEYHLISARDTGVMANSEYVSLLAQTIEVRRMLHGLLNTLDKGPKKKRRPNCEDDDGDGGGTENG